MSQPPGPADNATRFVSLLAGCERRLAAFVLSVVPNFADADELLQETKLRLWQQFDNYDPSKSFDTWARSIAYYQVLSYRKKLGREKLVFSTELLAALELSYSNCEKELDLYSQSLESCLKRLSKKSQALLARVYGGPTRMDEVARSCGMTLAAAQKALYRSRAALHECIVRRIQAEGKA
ncbi:RNA polymerase sigma factor [Pirellulimonas nuda]|uniref:RNA polymerase sigma factor n=1 Tax=Pirellulimonas nuda TaxID=2528009 RepID=A0A518DDU1_9BACT|nr:sigma-70 family RNA polymerase sigma factor [Pirellulimonas nuda]QDU89648.1 RNA polymerase sigma factor [Pirellulimonas nuda]